MFHFSYAGIAEIQEKRYRYFVYKEFAFYALAAQRNYISLDNYHCEVFSSIVNIVHEKNETRLETRYTLFIRVVHYVWIFFLSYY